MVGPAAMQKNAKYLSQYTKMASSNSFVTPKAKHMSI